MKLTLKKTIASILCISMIPSMMTGCKKESTSYSHTDFAMGTVTNTGPFQNCVVSAGAKTGTAQIGGSMKNGVFVAFAPYDEPEIAVALVLEKADAGAVLATTAVDIINAYFDREDTASILPENQLIP